jgi:hypothetical protein
MPLFHRRFRAVYFDRDFLPRAGNVFFLHDSTRLFD